MKQNNPAKNNIDKSANINYNNNMTTKQKLEEARQQYDSYDYQANEWGKELIRLETLYAKQNEVQVGDNFVHAETDVTVKLCRVFGKCVLIDSEGKALYSRDTLREVVDFLEAGDFVRDDVDDEDEDEEDEEDPEDSRYGEIRCGCCHHS